MNRTDWLYALVEELRARASRTMLATDLAERFGVTTRTIERDLLALQEAGVPIWARPGPGGGYGLNVDFTLPPVNLTPTEATALAATPTMPFAAAGRSALEKLEAVMATTPRVSPSKLVTHIRVAQHLGSPVDQVSPVMQQALLDSVAVELTYRDLQNRETVRVVEPAGLFGTGNGWYLAAWCRLRQAPRIFASTASLRRPSPASPWLLDRSTPCSASFPTRWSNRFSRNGNDLQKFPTGCCRHPTES